MKNEIIGKMFTNKYGTYKVVDYINANKVCITWIDSNHHTMFAQKHDVLRGAVKNPFCPIFYGVGYFGVGKHKTNGEYKTIYSVWKNMLKRCYSQEDRAEWPTYEGCTVSSFWHNYQNFAEWYLTNQYRQDGWHVDKDIIQIGNKEYSSEKCCFVPAEINALFTKANSIRGQYCIGVYKTKARPNLFNAACNDGTGKSHYLGCFQTEQEAFLAYKKFKESLIKQKAEKFKEVIDPRVYQSLINYVVKAGD